MTWVMRILLRQFWNMSKPLISTMHFILGDCKCKQNSLLSANLCASEKLNFWFNWCSRIIWLGDLNYRIALSYRAAKALVEMHDWKTLLENDQACYYFVSSQVILIDLCCFPILDMSDRLIFFSFSCV